MPTRQSAQEPKVSLLDAGSRGRPATTMFVIACTGLDDTLETIHSRLKRCSPLDTDNVYAADDPILIPSGESSPNQALR